MPSYVYFQKQIIPLSEAKIGVMTNSFHYGNACFEGVRGNWNDKQGQVHLFRLREHYERMLKGCQLLKIDLPYTIDDLCRITVEMVEKCAFQEDLYVRPVAYKSSEALGVRLHDLEDDFFVFAFPWGPYRFLRLCFPLGALFAGKSKVLRYLVALCQGSAPGKNQRAICQ